MFRDGWLTVNGVASHVLTWGGWVEDPLPEEGSIVIFMCGVPGITLFYHNFLETLYNSLKIPVWTICIAGQELPPASTNLQLPDDPKLYDNVKAQTTHKKAFVEEYVPKKYKIYFIGHSFGSKMVIELLKDDQIACQMEKCVLLMPTIERFGDTPRAKFWLMMINTGCVYTLVLFTWFLSILPLSWRKVFTHWYFQSRGLRNVHEHCYDAMVHFCHPTVFYNVRQLAWDELEAIKQLDTEILCGLRDKIKVYFAPDDYWAPLTHCETLKSAVPELSVEILDKKFIHAFTLATAEDMAEILIKDLKTAS